MSDACRVLRFGGRDVYRVLLSCPRDTQQCRCDDAAAVPELPHSFCIRSRESDSRDPVGACVLLLACSGSDLSDTVLTYLCWLTRHRRGWSRRRIVTPREYKDSAR